MNYKLFLFLFLASICGANACETAELDIHIVTSNNLQYAKLDCKLPSSDLKHYYLQTSEDLKSWKNFYYFGNCSKDKTFVVYDRVNREKRFYRLYKDKNKGRKWKLTI